MAAHQQTATSFESIIMFDQQIHRLLDIQQEKDLPVNLSMPRIGSGLRRGAFVMFSPQQVVKFIRPKLLPGSTERSRSCNKVPNPGMIDITKTNVVRNRRMTLERPKPYHGSATTSPDYCIVIFATVNCRSVYFSFSRVEYPTLLSRAFACSPRLAVTVIFLLKFHNLPIDPFASIRDIRRKTAQSCAGRHLNGLVMQETRGNRSRTAP